MIPPPPPSPPITKPTASPMHKVELVISNLLRIGVITSLTVIVLGTIISFAHHPDYLKSSAELSALTIPGHAIPNTLRDTFQGILEFRGQSIVMAGLLLLIATPVLRVAISIIAFLVQKDRLFALITAVVLALLLLSFLLGKAGG